MDVLRIENISKTYENQSVPAIKAVSFEVKKGEFFSIVGESGSGKTTLLNMIAGLKTIDSGAIFLENQKINNFSLNLVKGHPKIKPVFQDYNLLPYHKIRENIAYPLRSYTADYQQHRIEELLKLCRLEMLADKIPSELSGGEQQRTALAMALAQNPTLITADEPFSNLDGLLKQRFRAEFQRIIQEAGVTIIFVTHDVRDALSLSDRIAVMQKGQIIQIGTPQMIYQHPVNEYVAQLFGEMNWIPKAVFETYFQQKTPHQTAWIRPEKFQFCPAENAIFSGKIISRTYFGNYYLYKIQNTYIELTIQSLENKNIGEEIGIKLTKRY